MKIAAKTSIELGYTAVAAAQDGATRLAALLKPAHC